MGNDIMFEVLDSGIGIKAEEIPQLFKPFRQGVSGREVNTQGIGLGLAIAKKIVELHGGTIWIESEWGRGTCVSFKIPIVIDASTERLLQAGLFLDALRFDTLPAEAGEEPLALIVEDSAQAAEILRTYIASAGYRVEIARNGAEALEKAKTLQPSVITLDLMLPLKDGWQVLRELKQHPRCRHIPVIVVSITDEKKLGFSLGAVDYFVKPIQKEELLQALKRVHLVRVNERKTTVLVIDDDPATTELIQLILESEGYAVLKALRGNEGVEIAEREQPDLIILDLVMPDESGFTIAGRLKHMPSTRSIPIVILTSMDLDTETEQRLNQYVAALISKSTFTKRDLLREIGNI
jgi:CheY-like chemotaxis protein